MEIFGFWFIFYACSLQLFQTFKHMSRTIIPHFTKTNKVTIKSDYYTNRCVCVKLHISNLQICLMQNYI